MEKGQITQKHVNDYVLFQFNGLLETLGQFNYPHVYSMVSMIKDEFAKQSEKRTLLSDKHPRNI